ncbi:unnamed protein product [Diamesa serratosioi]
MSVNQYISEFNKLSKHIKNLSYAEEISLNNKLKIILNDFENLDIDSLDISIFFGNIYNLLSHSVDYKSGLTMTCLEILNVVASTNNRTKMFVLRDFRFFPVLIKHISPTKCEDDKLLKLLTLLRDLMEFQKEKKCSNVDDIDEINLRLIIPMLTDYFEHHHNPDICSMCLSVLSNIIYNKSAKLIMVRNTQSTSFRQKLSKHSEIIAFKLMFLLEDEISSKDFFYFLPISLKEISNSINDLNCESVKHSTDILFKMNQSGIVFEDMISDKSLICDLLCKLVEDLVTNIKSSSNTHSSSKIEQFYDAISFHFELMIKLDSKLASKFNDYIECIFTKHDKSNRPSVSTLSLLSTFVSCAVLKLEDESLNQIVDQIFVSFLNDLTDENLNGTSNDMKCALLNLLLTLFNKQYLTTVHLETLATYFGSLLENLEKNQNLLKMSDDELFMYMVALNTLASFSSSSATLFYAKLDAIFKLPSIPFLIARAFNFGNAGNEKMLNVIFQLTKVDEFPSQKVTKIISESNIRNIDRNLSNLNNPVAAYQNSHNSKKINVELEENLNDLINKLNETADKNNFANVRTSEVIELYRHKIILLNSNLTNVTSSLERAVAEVNELLMKETFASKISEKQELLNWGLQLDNERMEQEIKEIDHYSQSLKLSVATFQKKICKEEKARAQDLKNLTLKQLELQELKKEMNELEKVHAAAVIKHDSAQIDNLNRIAELKKSLMDFENQLKEKNEENQEALETHKKMTLRLSVAEKKISSLTDGIRMHERDLVKKQEEIDQYEIELKEAEQMKNSIMSLMAGRNNSKNKS